MTYKAWKWRKEDGDHWSYVPSLTDRNPFIVYVEAKPVPMRQAWPTSDYRARFGRVGMEPFSIAKWRGRPGQAREDARKFTGGHTSYDRLLDLYTELTTFHSREPEFVIPYPYKMRHHVTVQAMMDLAQILPAYERSRRELLGD